MFTAEDYSKLHQIVFQPDYPGYKPTVTESPNGDGKLDSDKRYAHVALKYLKDYLNTVSSAILKTYLLNAHEVANKVFESLNIDRAYRPDIRYSALRILEYPIDAVSNEHKDFDLFTLMCYRNIPELFEYKHDDIPKEALAINNQLHFGEILEIINPNLQASPHKVNASSEQVQHSIVYFSIPDHEARLPTGITVGDWLKERMSRSRY